MVNRTPQAQTVSPEIVQPLASYAEPTDPSIVDKPSDFRAHPTLVKSLGAGVLSVMTAMLAQVIMVGPIATRVSEGSWVAPVARF